MAYLLGLDIGTSATKAVLFDAEQGQTVAVASHEYPLHKPQPDRAEQSPEDWWQASVNTARRVLSQLNQPAKVNSIGLSGQMHGTVLLDKRDQPCHPAISWADQRSRAEVTQLINTVGEADYVATTGTLPAVGFLGASLLWLTKNQPAVIQRAKQVILPKDYVRLKLTGQVGTDLSDAAGTGLLNVQTEQWASKIIERAGLRHALLPNITPSDQVVGQLTESAAQALGLPRTTLVSVGCADQPAQAIGNGLVRPGRASITIGSGGQLFSPVLPDGEQPLPTDRRLHLFNHAVPDLRYVLGAILSAGLSLRWLRSITGLDNEPQAYQILSQEAAQVAAGSNGLLFLPYLSGERTPHLDPLARGGFIGLTHYHQRGHLARAVMEGVTFALRQCLELSQKLTGPVESVIIAGGGAQSPVWRQMQADILGLPVQQNLLNEEAGVGAAILAGVGTGIYPDLPTVCAQLVRYTPFTEPNPTTQAQYQSYYQHFCELYPRLRDDFHRLRN